MIYQAEHVAEKLIRERDMEQVKKDSNKLKLRAIFDRCRFEILYLHIPDSEDLDDARGYDWKKKIILQFFYWSLKKDVGHNAEKYNFASIEKMG